MIDRNAIRAALYTALWTFLGVFGSAVVGWLNLVMEWVSDNGQSAFPSTSVLGLGFASAATAAVSGLVAFIVRSLQGAGLVKGTPPVYPKS